MNTETPAPSGASFAGAGIEPGIQPEASRPLVPVHRPVETPLLPKVSKPPKAKRVVPEGAVIPTMGPQKFIYAIHRLIGRPDLVPNLSSKEFQAQIVRKTKELADESRRSKKLWLSEFFNSSGAMTVDLQYKEGQRIFEETHLKWTGQSIVIAVLTQKGGAGKTEVCVQLSRLFANLKVIDDKGKERAAVPLILIIPATRNPGSTTRKAGVATEDTLTLPEVETWFKDMEKQYDQARANSTVPVDAQDRWIDSKDILALLRKNADGVYVIAQTNLPADFDDKRYQWVMKRLSKIFTIIIEDTGNNTAKEGEIEFMAAQLADVLVFTCFTGVTDSPELMGATMDSYALLNQKDKLSSIISVVNGLKPDDSLENWKRYAEFKINEHGITTGIRDFPYRVSARDGMEQTGTLLAIPWDDAVALNRGYDIDQATSDAYLELAFQIALTKCRLQNLDYGLLDRIGSIKTMVAEFDSSLLSEHYRTPQAWIAAHERGETSPPPERRST
jgi:cellulose biosynthesis protein BcsQ